MPKVVEDENGKEMTMFSQEELEAAKKAEEERLKTEYEAKLAEKDQHVKTKLEEFTKGKTAQELKEIETEKKIEEAKRIAEEASGRILASESRRIETLKRVAMEKFTGNNQELTKKFEDAWGLVNLEIKDDADVARKAELVANMTGLNFSDQNFGSMSLGGAKIPNFSREDTKEKEASYNQFKDTLGLDNFINEVKGPEQK